MKTDKRNITVWSNCKYCTHNNDCENQDRHYPCRLAEKDDIASLNYFTTIVALLDRGFSSAALQEIEGI